MKNLIASAILLLTLASCAGRNASVTGAVLTDYIPSVLMLIGTAILAYAGTRLYKGYKIGFKTDEGFALKQSAFIIGVGSLVFLIMGIATYLW